MFSYLFKKKDRTIGSAISLRKFSAQTLDLIFDDFEADQIQIKEIKLLKLFQKNNGLSKK